MDTSSATLPDAHVYPGLTPIKRLLAKVGVEMVVTYVVAPPGFDMTTMTSTPVEWHAQPVGANKLQERVGIVVAASGQKKSDLERFYYFWGVVSVVELFLLEGMTWPPVRDESITVVVHRSDCQLEFGAIEPTLAAVYEDPSDGQPLSSLLPAQPITLDDARLLMAQRLAHYKHPTDSCLLRTDADRRRDRLSYTLALTAMATYTPRTSMTKKAWLEGEMRIARHRMRVAHIPDLLASRGWQTLNIQGEGVDEHCEQCKNAGHTKSSNSEVKCDDPVHHWGYNIYNGCGGVDFINVPDLMGIARGPLGTLIGGRLLTDPALYIRHAMLMQEAQHKSNLAHMAPSEEDRDDIFKRFYVAVWASREGILPNLHPTLSDALRKKTKRTIVRVEIEEGAQMQPINGFDDLKKVMPGCMREMSDIAFNPYRREQDHLLHQDRVVFFHFLLVQGFDKTLILAELDQKLRGTKYAADGGLKKQLAAVEGAQKDADSGKYGYMYGCNKLMAEGKCPFFHGNEGRARVACHGNQLALAHLQTDPDGQKWSIGFPVRFSQKMKRLLATAKPAAGTIPSYYASL